MMGCLNMIEKITITKYNYVGGWGDGGGSDDDDDYDGDDDDGDRSDRIPGGRVVGDTLWRATLQPFHDSALVSRPRAVYVCNRHTEVAAAASVAVAEATVAGAAAAADGVQ